MENSNRGAFQKEFLDHIEVYNSVGKMNFAIDNLYSLKEEFDATYKESIRGKNTKPVLGLDIFEYSQRELPEQILIPVVFDILFKSTTILCNAYEPTLFWSFPYNERFIPTGDGGFLILDNLFQAIVFNINFHVSLRLFNGKYTDKDLSNFVGEVIIRSCITNDFCYQYRDYYSKQDNYYGPAIINSARIMAKDKLNRFLIDHNTYMWFLENFNGIENLNTTTIDLVVEKLIEKYPDIYTRDRFNKSYLQSDIFPSPLLKQDSGHDNIKSILDHTQSNVNQCLIQKVGKIRSKKTELEVYNVLLQRRAKFNLHPDIDAEADSIVVSVGNLNTAGISED